MRNDIPFLDLILHNPTNLMIDGVTHAVEIDPCGPANYIFTSSGLEKKLADLEVIKLFFDYNLGPLLGCLSYIEILRIIKFNS